MQLELKNINKSFGEKQVLNGISLKADGGIGILSAKIYRAGVVMYGNKPKLLKLIKTVIKS